MEQSLEFNVANTEAIHIDIKTIIFFERIWYTLVYIAVPNIKPLPPDTILVVFSVWM